MDNTHNNKRVAWNRPEHEQRIASVDSFSHAASVVNADASNGMEFAATVQRMFYFTEMRAQ